VCCLVDVPGHFQDMSKSISTGAPHSGHDSDLGADVVFGLAPVRSNRRRLVFEPNRIADTTVSAPSRRARIGRLAARQKMSVGSASQPDAQISPRPSLLPPL
jgi:hypothetical protein